MVDLNAGVENVSIKDFCTMYSLTSMINKPTCYKNPSNPSCIDLILTNYPRSFQNSCVIETGLSDFHKIVVTVMKTSYKKLEPKIINYRSYKFFCNEDFRASLHDILPLQSDNNCEKHFDNFISSCNNVLDQHALKKKKYVRRNKSPFINKVLMKAIMLRTKLRNIFLKYKTEESRIKYNQQRNLCVTLLRKSKRNYYNSLNEKIICDNKKFWKTIKPSFYNKIFNSENITLVEENEIIKSDYEVAHILNDYFSNIVVNLDIPEFDKECNLHEGVSNPLLKAILKYNKHPSIAAIKAKCDSKTLFNFLFVQVSDIMEEIKSLQISKATQDNDIPTKLIKNNSDIFASFICLNFNKCIAQSTFPASLKSANVIPIFKKDTKSCKSNYRPISILSNISKIYERIIFKQISKYFSVFFSKFQCGFRKGFSVQTCLLAMLEKWKSAVDDKKVFGALLTDFSKAFDCLSHDLLIAKLNAYGFSLSSLKLMHSYLTDRIQRTRVSSDFSPWKTILFGLQYLRGQY